MKGITLEVSASHISTAIYDWLEEEIRSSSSPDNVNSYLDSLDRARRGLKGGFEHPDNFAWGKLSGHLNRLKIWLMAFSMVEVGDKDFDQQAAKLAFAGLMQVSGSYRDQCYVEAQNQEDYWVRRQKVIGIDIFQEVQGRLNVLLPSSGEMVDAHISVEALDERREEVSEIGEKAVKTLCSRVMLGYDLGESGSRSAEGMIAAQQSWLGFAVDSLVLVAKLKQGDLSEVPFREPRSDNEQSGRLFYPMRERVDWAEALAV